MSHSTADLLRALLLELRAAPTVCVPLAGRLYLGLAPAGAVPPYLVVSRVGSSRDYAQDGPTGMRSQRLQFSLWARDELKAIELVDAVSDVLDALPAAIGRGAFVVNVLDSQQAGEYSDFSQSNTGDGGLHFASVDYEIQWRA